MRGGAPAARTHPHDRVVEQYATPHYPVLHGFGWHFGQKNDERFMKCSRTIGAPQRPQGRPVWPYAASERSKYPDAPLTCT